AVERDDELLGFSKRNLVRGGPSLASLAHALADVVRHAPRCTLHLTAKLGLAMWKAGDDRTDLPVELKCTSIDVELVKVILARSVHRAPPGRCPARDVSPRGVVHRLFTVVRGRSRLRARPAYALA